MRIRPHSNFAKEDNDTFLTRQQAVHMIGISLVTIFQRT